MYIESLSIYEGALADLAKEKISSKQQYKQDLISQRDYMITLDGIQKREFMCQNELKSQFHRIFDDLLSECTHSDNLQEIILGFC
jgi:hypothetical protein